MAVSTVTVLFSCKRKSVWDVVTSLEAYDWRSDLEKIEILEPGRKFKEHTRDGFSTTFTITALEPYDRYEFDMENENMKGHWTGLFSERDGDTKIVFTENVTAKKVFMRPFVGLYLKKQQAAYIKDLKKRMEEKKNAGIQI